MIMQAHPTLVLNADFRPMSYFPLSLLCWEDAVHAVFSERVSVVAEYDTWVRSPSTKIRLPSVVALASISQPRAVSPSHASTCSCVTASRASTAARGSRPRR